MAEVFHWRRGAIYYMFCHLTVNSGDPFLLTDAARKGISELRALFMIRNISLIPSDGISEDYYELGLKVVLESGNEIPKPLQDIVKGIVANKLESDPSSAHPGDDLAEKGCSVSTFTSISVTCASILLIFTRDPKLNALIEFDVRCRALRLARTVWST